MTISEWKYRILTFNNFVNMRIHYKFLNRKNLWNENILSNDKWFFCFVFLSCPATSAHSSELPSVRYDWKINLIFPSALPYDITCSFQFSLISVRNFKKTTPMKQNIAKKYLWLWKAHSTKIVLVSKQKERIPKNFFYK